MQPQRSILWQPMSSCGILLWMDEIHFAPPKKPWNDSIPPQIPNKQWFQPWFPQWCFTRTSSASTAWLPSHHPIRYTEPDSGAACARKLVDPGGRKLRHVKAVPEAESSIRFSAFLGTWKAALLKSLWLLPVQLACSTPRPMSAAGF